MKRAHTIKTKDRKLVFNISLILNSDSLWLYSYRWTPLTINPSHQIYRILTGHILSKVIDKMKKTNQYFLKLMA